MTTFSKKAFKGLPMGIKIRKPRHYYKDLCSVYGEDSNVDINVEKYAGVPVVQGVGEGFVSFKEDTLWDRTVSPAISRVLAPYYNGELVSVNYETIGSVANKSYVVSGFSSSNYLQIPATSLGDADNWEIFFKATTGSDTISIQSLFHLRVDASNKYGVLCDIEPDNRINMYLTFNGSSWASDSAFTSVVDNGHVLEANTTYYFRFSFDGSCYRVEVSKNNIDWDIAFERYSTTKVYSNLTIAQIGVYNSSSPWKGSIDLNESYIKVNGQIAWGLVETREPYAYEYLTYTGWSYNVVGNPNIENNIVSNFSNDNYIGLPFINFGSGTWEVNLKVTTSADDLTNESPIISCNTDSKGFRIGTGGTTKGRWEFLVSNGSSWIFVGSHIGSHVVQADTDYWLKAGYDGSKYYLKYSTDGIDYIDDISYNSSVKMVSYDEQFGYIDIGDSKWHGSIDLNECYIKVNGVGFWGKNILSVAKGLGCMYGDEEAEAGSTYNIFSNANDVTLKADDTDIEGYTWAGTFRTNNIPEIHQQQYTEVGQLSYDSNCNASGFSASNYILSPSLITEPESNTYLFVTRVTTGGDSGSRNIFWTNSSPDYGCGTASSNRWRFWRGSAYYGGSFEYNTSYWVAVMQYPDQTILYYMKDDGTFKDISELPLPAIRGVTQPYWSTGATYNGIVYGTDVIRVGNGYAATSEYWEGNIDLSNTAIYKNYNNTMATAEVIWKPFKTIPAKRNLDLS